METKGFTLVELIAVIVVLVAIFLVSFPSFMSMTKEAEENEYNDMIDNLCLAGKSYIYANMDKFDTNSIGKTIEVTISTLEAYGNIDKDSTDGILIYTVNEDYSLDCKFEEQ